MGNFFDNWKKLPKEDRNEIIKEGAKAGAKVITTIIDWVGKWWNEEQEQKRIKELQRIEEEKRENLAKLYSLPLSILVTFLISASLFSILKFSGWHLLLINPPMWDWTKLLIISYTFGVILGIISYLSTEKKVEINSTTIVINLTFYGIWIILSLVWSGIMWVYHWIF